MDNKLFKFLKEKQYLVIALIFIVTLVGNCNSCRREKEAIEIQEATKKECLQTIQDVKKNIITKEELETMLAIERYKISNEVVYTNNAIVRTVERPDDVMKKYTQEIEKLTKELEKIRTKKDTLD